MSAPRQVFELFFTVHKSLRLFTLLVYLYILTQANCIAERRLKLAQVLYRHGDRSPGYSYPNDIYQEDTWPGGFGQLTEHGMMQQLELGKWLRKRYITDQPFLSESYERTELTVISTFRDRTIMSALSNLQGLYPRNKDIEGDQASMWRPIAVHSLPEECDDFLHVSHFVCPRLDQLNKSVMAQKYIADNQDFFDDVSIKAGLKTPTLVNMDRLGDSLKFQKSDGRTLPAWVTDDIFKKLLATMDYKFFIAYNNGSTEYKRLQAGPLIGKLLSNIKNHLNGSDKHTKLFMYSAHDSSIAALLGGLGFIFTRVPPTASCVIIELYTETDGSHTVDLYFRNSTDLTEPLKPMKIPACTEHCPIEIFYFLTHKVIPTDHKAECHVKVVEEWSKCRRMALLPIVAFIMIALLLFVIKHQLKLSMQRKSFQILLFVYVIMSFLFIQWYCITDLIL